MTLVTTACPVAFARIAASDATATHSYLEATVARRRAQEAAAPAALEAIQALAARVKAECPGVLAGAPPHVKGEKTNHSETEISDELLSVGFGAGAPVEHPADARFAKTVRRLRWSKPKLTRLLRSLALEQAEQSAIALPDLCTDMKYWVASNYTATSAGTKRFLHRQNVVSSTTFIDPEPNEPAANFFKPAAIVAYRLKRYETHADRLLARKAFPPEVKITNPAVRPLLEAVGSIYAALGRVRPS